MVGYTSRGLGACVLPFRSFCPGEVRSVTLRKDRRASPPISGR